MAISSGSDPKGLMGQKKPGPINNHKAMAMEGAPAMGSLSGQKYDHPASVALNDAARAHRGRDAKSKPSHAMDVDHGHKYK